ncbi:MAG TPA: protease inhibitor I9 family protein, partial [Thermoanaerobaculia bacterium]|nr:protease inhibitor I9 family protein [Thermoanaerobaculia bacterium]
MRPLFVAAALLACALPAYAEEIRERYLVATARGADLRLAGAVSFDAVDGMAVELTAGEAEVLARKPGVRFVERDELRYVTTVAAPPHLDNHQVTPWGVDNIHAPAAWLLTRGDGVRV